MRRMILILLLFSTAAPAYAADADQGKEVFARCQMCHALEANAGAKPGPDLHGLFGRKAGSLSGFAYSPAMKDSGVTWGADTLAKFLRDPRDFIPGNRMGFPGVKNAEDLDDLLAYLKEATQ